MQFSPRHIVRSKQTTFHHQRKGSMSDIESSPAKEIEIDADGEDEGLLRKSSSSEPEPEVTKKTDTKKTKSDRANSLKGKSRKKHRKLSTSSSGSSSVSTSCSRSRSRKSHHKATKRRLSRSRSRSPQYRFKHSRHDSRREYEYERLPEDLSPCSNGRNVSPVASRKSYLGDRENPVPNRCIGVFGLSLYTQERGLWEVFGRFGQINEVQVVYDRQTGRSRGFAFVYFRSTDDAYEAKYRCDGMEIDGRKIRVDFSITEGPHPPTPGVYLGRSAERYYSSHRSPDHRARSYQRSESSYNSYGYQRSYSPDRKYY